MYKHDVDILKKIDRLIEIVERSISGWVVKLRQNFPSNFLPRKGLKRGWKCLSSPLTAPQKESCLYLSVYLYTYSYIYLVICLFSYFSFKLFAKLCICLSTVLSIHLFINMIHIYPSICLFIYPSLHLFSLVLKTFRFSFVDLIDLHTYNQSICLYRL